MSDTTDARARMAQGYGPEPQPGSNRRKIRAEAWRYDERLEEAKRLKEIDPSMYDNLSGDVKTALGYYENDKAAAQAEGIDTSNPEGSDAA